MHQISGNLLQYVSVVLLSLFCVVFGENGINSDLLLQLKNIPQCRQNCIKKVSQIMQNIY